MEKPVSVLVASDFGCCVLLGPFTVELNIQTRPMSWRNWKKIQGKQAVAVLATPSYLTLCDPTDYIVHGVLQARILEWAVFPFSRRSSQPKDQTQVSRTAGRFFTSWATREAPEVGSWPTTGWVTEELLPHFRGQISHISLEADRKAKSGKWSSA